MKSTRVAVMLLALASSALAGTFSVYPGAKKNPDLKHRQPKNATSYSTPDSFQEVFKYYKVRGRAGKVSGIGNGMFTVEVHFDSGEGILINGFQKTGVGAGAGPQGTAIVVDSTNKK